MLFVVVVNGLKVRLLVIFRRCWVMMVFMVIMLLIFCLKWFFYCVVMVVLVLLKLGMLVMFCR